MLIGSLIKNIERYRRLLQTNRSPMETQFVELRIRDEQAIIDVLTEQTKLFSSSSKGHPQRPN